MKVKKILLREETEKVLHTKSNGDKLVADSDGHGYSAYTKNNTRIGHIRADSDVAAITEFSKKEPKYESMNEDYLDSAEYRIQRYEDEIPDLFHKVHDGYMNGMVNAKAYADVLARIYSVLEELDYGTEIDEAMNLSPEGKALKRAIKNIVVDTDEELKEYVMQVTQEVIDERDNKTEGLIGDISVNLDASGSSVGFLGGTAGLTNESTDDDFMDAESIPMNELDSYTGKEEDIEFVMSEYIPDSLLIEFVKKIEKNKYLVGVEDEAVTVEFDPNWSEYVYTIEGKGPYSHSSYEYISRDVYDFVMANRTDNSVELDEDYGNDEMTEFLNWIQDYNGGCLWDAFTTEFNMDEDPDIDDVLNWLEGFNNDAYYAYIEKDEYDDDYEDLSAFKECSEVKKADALYGVKERGELVEAVYTDTNGIMGIAGETYTTAELRKIWNDNHNDDPSMANYNGDYDKWVSDTLAQMSRNDDVDEAFDMSYGPDLGKLSWQVASFLDVDALGEDNWIEFISDDPRDVVGGTKTMRFEAIGENDHKYGFIRTAGNRVEVKFRNGSEALCNNVEEIARFIAGEFGVSI